MREPKQALPEIDFATFVLSLASNALAHLGELPSGEPPAEGGPLPPAESDLPLAKQTIDMLAMIEEKTRGNLDEGEQQLLTSVLYDLRVKYVDASRPAK
jgi:hypothetical protein